MRKKRAVQLILTLLLVATMIGSGFGAYLTYKSYVEIYGVIHPLGEVEIEINPLPPIEGLEAREDYLGEIRVWTYSNHTELLLQLTQASQIVTNFREFTVKVCLPLDMIFVVDTTDSMSPYIDAVKKNLTNIVDILSLTYEAPLRFGAISFRDYPDETETLSLTDDYAAVKGFIDDLTVVGGIPTPQGHCWGLQAAKDEFDAHSAIEIEKVIVFVSDAEAGFDNAPSFSEAKEEADALAKRGIKINAVLCGPDEAPENEQLRYYANVSGGQFIGSEGQNRIFNAIISHPTWKMILTPITPFDSFHLRLNSSPPCQKEGYYTFYVYVSFYANAFHRHERFYFELMANLEKDQPCAPAPRDIAVTNVMPSKTIVGQGYSISINVTVANHGSYTETFNVTAYANTTVIDRAEVTITTRSPTTITFTWETAGFAKGNYTIKAYATPVPGETDLADNSHVDGSVLVTVAGDIDGDYDVDSRDLFLLARAYGSSVGQPGYNPNADLDCNGKVDYRDLLILARNYGKKDPP